MARSRGPPVGPPESSRDSDDLSLLGFLRREPTRTRVPATVDRWRNDSLAPCTHGTGRRAWHDAHHARDRLDAQLPPRPRPAAWMCGVDDDLDRANGASLVDRVAMVSGQR